MNKVALFMLLMVPTFFWAAPPSEHPINVHVTSSCFVAEPGRFSGATAIQKLNVLIDGKKYELTALAGRAGLLAPGDYKASLVRDEHKTAYESSQEYEFLFPDKSTRKFYVTGRAE
jgi:hypothetical protein